ncbi:hypothetical protein [Actinomycetospora termitidis]|uniref:Uncharacterized protein n=1 Tax=Actinomycetospora termitidis TaxID=3053470 RepID=A0ABT7MD63_9PSEU|nr:hypothetical protein [Actinomycetospora sp. Odt1-22]MDL5158611.1 hypothetical protein [Actinomycetospora sp. Odt1-22]
MRARTHRNALMTLLLRARSTVLLRRRVGRYPELSDAAVNVVTNGLTTLAVDPTAAPGELHDEATALAHRILDDDHPEASVLWPAAGPDLPVTNWSQVVRPAADSLVA